MDTRQLAQSQGHVAATKAEMQLAQHQPVESRAEVPGASGPDGPRPAKPMRTHEHPLHWGSLKMTGGPPLTQKPDLAGAGLQHQAPSREYEARIEDHGLNALCGAEVKLGNSPSLPTTRVAVTGSQGPDVIASRDGG